MKKRIAAACLLLGMIRAVSATEQRDGEIDRPNVILLMGDDHGWEETGYNGHPDVKTPVLDEMAAAGLRLDRFYAAHPSCSPTRGSVLTGRHPNRYGTFTPGLEDGGRPFVFGELAGIEPFLFGQRTLVELQTQDEPDRRDGKVHPGDRGDRSESAPSAQKESDTEKQHAQSQ